MTAFPFQFHHVFVAAVHVDHNVDPIGIQLVREGRNVLHESDNKCNSSAAGSLHLRAATGAHNLLAKEIVLLEATVISC